MRIASQTPSMVCWQSASRLAIVLVWSAIVAGCSLTSITERAVDSKTITSTIPKQAAQDAQVVSDETTVRNAVSSVDPNAGGAQIPWANADTGSRGAISALIERKENGGLCRTFQTTRESFDGVALYNGKACMDDSGAWRMMAFSPQ